MGGRTDGRLVSLNSLCVGWRAAGFSDYFLVVFFFIFPVSFAYHLMDMNWMTRVYLYVRSPLLLFVVKDVVWFPLPERSCFVLSPTRPAPKFILDLLILNCVITFGGFCWRGERESFVGV